MLKSRLLPSCLLATLVTALGCSSTPSSEGQTDEALSTDNSASDSSGDASSISFDAFDDDLNGAGSSEVHRIFTSASSYSNYFGHDAPPEVDFSSQWVVFYSAGSESSDGFRASIESLSVSGASLYVTTRLESPADDCSVAQTSTTPHVFVRFDKPAPRPRYVRYQTDDATISCGGSGGSGSGDSGAGGDDGGTQDDPCADVTCAPQTHCDMAQGYPKCVYDPCPGAGRRNGRTHRCECKVLGICALGMSWNDDPAVCGCE